MFKLLTLLCGTLFLALLIGGRDGGPVRYGLVPGKMMPLVYEGDKRPAVQEEAVAATDPAPEPPVVKPARKAAPRVIEAAFVQQPPADQTQAQAGLTLALPLVRPGDAAAVAEAPAPPTEPVILYVQGSSVNVRAGPSAETEALTKLPRGEAVLVLPSDTPGWSLIRIEGDGVEGYIASRFLGDRTEDGLFSNVD